MSDIHAYILANGQSRRFNHDPKALRMLGNQRVIEHVIQRIQLQALSVTINSSDPIYTALGLELVGDITPGHAGPVAGLYACMKHLCARSPSTWLLLSACDTPFVPLDLTATLLHDIQSAKMACIRYGGFLQPTFSIWHTDLLNELETAVVKKGIQGFKPFIDQLGDQASIVDYPESAYPQPNPFFNINTPADLIEAEKQIHHEQRH